VTYEEGYAAGVEDTKAERDTAVAEALRWKTVCQAIQLWLGDCERAGAESFEGLDGRDAHIGAGVLATLHKTSAMVKTMVDISKDPCSFSTPKQR
jgi:hypothetical protein